MIGLGDVHRIANSGTVDLVFCIEVQHGAHLDEADIERLEDDYGREVTEETRGLRRVSAQPVIPPSWLTPGDTGVWMALLKVEAAGLGSDRPPAAAFARALPTMCRSETVIQRPSAMLR